MEENIKDFFYHNDGKLTNFIKEEDKAANFYTTLRKEVNQLNST